MISALIDAHRASVLDDEANFDPAGNPLDALAVRASEAAEQRAFIALATAQCTNGEEVQDKVHYFATGTVGERSTLAVYLLEHSDGDFVLLQQFVASLSLQNGKGSATAPTVPSHGSTIPPKEKLMNDTTNTTAPAKRKVTDGEVASAFRDLEGAILELMHISDIAAEKYDELLSPQNRIGGKDGTYRMTDHEVDQMAFLVNNVASRCTDLHSRFHAACRGEVRA